MNRFFSLFYSRRMLKLYTVPSASISYVSQDIEIYKDSERILKVKHMKPYCIFPLAFIGITSLPIVVPLFLAGYILSNGYDGSVPFRP